VRRTLSNIVLGLLALSVGANCQLPKDFHWVDLRHEADVVSRFSQALGGEEFSAIREIGLLGDSALVFTTLREPGAATPHADRWKVYSVPMDGGAVRMLLTGYELRIMAWMPFLPRERADLAITYMDCFGCEPTVIFTALHYESGQGWRARWPNQDSPDIPGIQLASSDWGIPYDEDLVDQVWASMGPLAGPASIGTWYHSVHVKTGKVSSVTMKFRVDPATGKEESLTLHGADAVAWQKKLCKPTDAHSEILGGQESQSCKVLLKMK
jgi:hypothetical protein